MFWEQFGVVKEELYQNILYAVICVLVLCCTMIAHPGQGALVTGMVLMTLVAMGVSAAAGGSAWAVAVADSDGFDFCGEQGVDWLIGHHIDAIGMVCFAFAVGISVDYSV